jgi:AcrR family transcriptional regulator
MRSTLAAGTDKEDIKDAIVAAAAGLFARHGYRATTLEAVASAVGVKKASVYHYIASKEELLIAIYDRIFDRIESAVGPVASLDFSPDERLRRMIHAHIEIVADERDLLTVVFNEEAELPEPLKRKITRRKRAYEQLFVGVLEEGKSIGVFRDIDTRTAVFGLLGMCNWLHKWYRPEHGTPGEIASVFALLCEYGLMTEPDRTQGAWPRPTDAVEALEVVTSVADSLARDVDRLREELDRAEQRLRHGLAGKNSSKRRLKPV